MSVDVSHAVLLKQWFTPVGDDKEDLDFADRQSMRADLERISELLSELWFSADYSWTRWSDSDVLAVLQQWMSPDSPDEMPFLQCAVAGKLGDFITWIEPAIRKWETQETQSTAERGIENSEYGRDPIAGTKYYRWIDGEYVYSDSADEPYVAGGLAWLSLDARIAAQDLANPHYDLSTDRWRRPGEGGIYEYQDRDDKEWERTDGTSWLRRHSDVAGWLPYDKTSRSWFHQDQWRTHDQVAVASAPRQESQVIPIHEISGWGHLARESWAQGWYALVAPDGYSYLHSPDRRPTPEDAGWSDVPPAPPLERAPIDQGLAAAEQICVDHVVPAAIAFFSENPDFEVLSEEEMLAAFVEVLTELASKEGK